MGRAHVRRCRMRGRLHRGIYINIYTAFLTGKGAACGVTGAGGQLSEQSAAVFSASGGVLGGGGGGT
jgi:hypothetical protein